MLRFEANSVGEEEGVEGGQSTGKVRKDGGEASAQVIELRGVPSQSTCFKQKDDVDDCFARRQFVVSLRLLDAR